ncbi:MAG: GAF domain-containing protein [Gammaproteobacteria bacterium]|nr:GAF domain-containing protein [Gammaproteobacteria bacterium]MDE2345741.1 GAF domain-containing protein [Gammaproteobacteria bacterium]
MRRRLWVSALLTVVGVAAYIQLVLTPQLPGVALSISPYGASDYVISPIADLPLPVGLNKGDILEMNRMSPATRAALLLGQPITPGTRVEIVIRRAERVLSVPVTSQFLPNTFISRYSVVLLLRNGLFLVILALGILSIWRGRDLAASGLGLFALAVIVSASLRSIAVSPAWAVWMQLLSEIGVVPFIFVGLFLVAYSVSGSSLGTRSRKGFTGAFMLSYLLLVILTISSLLGKVYFLSHGLPTPVLPTVVCVLALIPLMILVLGYAQAGPEQRLRIRWILCSTGVFFLALIFEALATTSSDMTRQLEFTYILELLLILAVSGYTYAVLRHRLVDVRVVINRTLVYAVITALVVGIFAAISSFTERAALGRSTSLLLELIVPLALGIVLSTLRKYIDTYVNRFLFHRKYAAEKALNDFARTCDFIEQPERLLDQTVQQVFKHTHAVNVALYERDARGYRRVRQQGNMEMPEHVEADDPAFVRLRAGEHEIDMHGTESALGRQGYAFPMSVRGRLIGALACGPRPAEQYTVDERQLLAHVARQVGAAIHTLRSLEHEKFVDSVANGELNAASAREHARRLQNLWQTT